MMLQGEREPVPPQGDLQSQAQAHALVSERSELKDQLRELTSRRHDIAEQAVVEKDPAHKRELQTRLREIDQRSARIDARIDALDDQIASAMASGAFGMPPTPMPPQIPEIPVFHVPPFGNPGLDTRTVAGLLAGEALAFILLGFAFWQFGWRRMRAHFASSIKDQTYRLEQIQQAIDVVSVEVERISEGQRFVSKVIGEGDASLPLGRKEKSPATLK